MPLSDAQKKKRREDREKASAAARVATAAIQAVAPTSTIKRAGPDPAVKRLQNELATERAQVANLKKQLGLEHRKVVAAETPDDPAVKLASWMEATNAMFQVAPGSAPAVPDDSGDSTWTAIRGQQNILQLRASSGSGEIAIAFGPRARRGTAISGAFPVDGAPLGDYMSAACNLGMPDLDRQDAFLAGYSNYDTWLEIQEIADDMSTGTTTVLPSVGEDVLLGPYTVPFSINWNAADDSYAYTCRAVYSEDVDEPNSGGFFVQVGDLFADSNAATVAINGIIEGFTRQATTTADFAFMIVGSELDTPNFRVGTGLDQYIVIGNNVTLGSGTVTSGGGSGGNIAPVVHVTNFGYSVVAPGGGGITGDLSTYRSFYVVIYKADNDPLSQPVFQGRFYLTALSLEFSNLVPLETMTSTIGTAGLYAYDNKMLAALGEMAQRAKARWVGGDVTVRNLTPKMYEGGATTIVAFPATDSTGVFERLTNQTITSKRGGRLMNLATGAHGFLKPTSEVNYRRYVSLMREGFLEGDPIIFILITVPQVVTGDEITGQAPVSLALMWNVVYQIITNEPVLNPTCDNGLAQSPDDASEVFRRAMLLLRLAPTVGENPTHEEWVKKLNVLARQGLHFAKDALVKIAPMAIEYGSEALLALL
jgi:hypothetical protein